MGVHVDNPVTLPAPAGKYSHVSRVSAGELVFVAGQLALDAGGNLVGKGDIWAQVKGVFDNLRSPSSRKAADSRTSRASQPTSCDFSSRPSGCHEL